MPAEESFFQLKLQFIDPLQHDYEVVRPIVLFSQPVAERSRETAFPRTTVSDKAKRFVTEGMLGLVDKRTQPTGRQERGFPDPIANHILYLKQLYPPINYREIVRIIGNKFSYVTNHGKVKRFLDRNPFPVGQASRGKILLKHSSMSRGDWQLPGSFGRQPLKRFKNNTLLSFNYSTQPDTEDIAREPMTN